MRIDLSLRGQGQHTVQDLEGTPRISSRNFLSEVRMLKPVHPRLTSPRTLVTDLSLRMGISKPASRGSGPHRDREVTTLHNASRQNTPSALFCRLGSGHQTTRPKHSGKKAEERSIMQFTITRDVFPLGGGRAVSAEQLCRLKQRSTGPEL